LGPATLENLCRFIFVELADFLPTLTKVSVERQASGDRCCLSK
jgi:6-pyruvoyltetrahydropterin/6-carboxytetrahydropterin synthase